MNPFQWTPTGYVVGCRTGHLPFSRAGLGGFSGGTWWHMDVQDKETQVWRAGPAAGGRERLAGA